MRRIWTWTIALLLTLCILPGTARAMEGTLGEDVTWTLDDTGTLTISGTSYMPSYGFPSDFPWYSYRLDITTVVIDGVTNIGRNAFGNCYNLTSVNISDSVTFIGSYAFANCDSLISVSISEHVTRIEDHPFCSCDNLTGIWVDDSNEFYTSDEFGALYNESRNLLIQVPGALIGSYCIPESVTRIYDGAFQGCLNLTSVSIPDSVSSIGEDAFFGCESLTGVCIPDDVSVIDDFVFYGCENLTDVSIGNGIISIGCNAFQNCTSLTNVNIPDGVTSIGHHAFYGCSSLSGELTIPGGVTTIGVYAFYGCKSLTEVNIGNNVTSIGKNAFSYCVRLTSVSIPGSITSIGEKAFYECDSLTDVYYGGSESQWGAISIGGDNYLLKNATIHFNSIGPGDAGSVPEGAYVRYFYSWDAENQIAYFNTDPEENPLNFGSQVTEETDTSFLENVDELVGTYVLVKTQVRDDGMLLPDILISIEPLEVKTGTVISADADTIIIGDESYATPAFVSDPAKYVDHLVDYYLYNGEIVKIDILDSALTVLYLSSWDEATQTVYFGAADQTSAKVTEATDTAFLGNLDAMLERYVLAELDTSDEETLLVSLMPVDSKAGTVDNTSTILTSITIDGITHSILSEEVIFGVYPGDTVLYHMHEGKVVGITPLKKEECILSAWDSETYTVEVKAKANSDSATTFELGYLLKESASQLLEKLSPGNRICIAYDSNDLIFKLEILSYGNVKYFSEWDSENKIAYFGLNPLSGHKTCEDTNPEFYENAEKLVGHFVLVEETSMDNDFERFVINAYPVEERRGMVSTADATSIIIDGIPYTTPESMPFPQGYENKEVVYYLYDGQLVGVGSLQSEMGMLKSWDSETKRLVVDPEGLTDKSTLYVLSDLADEATIAFLGFTGQTHESVIYSYAGDFVYSMSSYLPPEEPDYYDTYIPMTEDEEQFFLLAEDWMRAYEEYISAVDKAMMALAGSDEETREEIISRQADAMQKSDRESTSQYLTGSLGAYSNEAYHALATFLYDYTCKNAEFSSVDLSNNMAEINIINNVMKALWNEKQEYEYGRVKIAISAFGYGSTSMGQMTIHVNGNVYSSGIVICSSKSDCEEAVNAFVEELKDLATNASYNVASALYKDILGKSLSSLSTEYVSKAVTMLEKKFAVVLSEKFNKAGVGNVIHMLDECYTYYTWVYQAANSGNLDELPAAMAKVTGLKFEDSTIADGVSKAAVKLLRKASKAFLCAYEDYLEDLGSEGSAITGKALINCPVNVMVLNSSGEQIGYVGEDDIWYSDTIRICDIGGAKEIISYTDDLLTFEMCATGYGTMSCSFEEYESDGTLLGRLNFYNIPIEPDQTFSIALSEDYQANADTISIISGDMTIFADEYIDVADDGGVAIRCEVSGEGSISGVGTHVRGDAVVLNAVPAEGNVFLGWYEEESLLCISNTFEFTATKNRYLVAKFGAIDYYMVSVFSEEGGYVIGNGRYSPGELATIYAIPDNGFVFDGWYVNGECVSMNSEYTFSVASEMQLLGKFSRVGSEENAIIRIAGDDRIATSLMLADQLKEVQNVEKFDAVVVASALNFPDALTGSYLAAEKNAPILLTYPAAHAKIRAYIQENLKPGGMVYILGGEGAVSADFADGLSGFSVKRVAGSDRFGTNLAIMKEAGVSADQPVLIATATNFADSLSASAAGLPMVLVYGSLREDQKEFLATTSKNFIIIGGEAAVSKSLENELAAIGSVTRVAGSSRYETSVLVAERFVQNPDAVILAYARNFPDGLCGGPLAYALGAPLILTDSGAPGTADAYVENITAGIVVGGSGLISDSATRDIFDLAANAEIQTK